jgi:carbonic anhydrase/acetyltransferase-like protein (isoleucine patch superfamily)
MDAWFDTKGKGSFVMGRNSVINQKCRLDNRGSIVIGDNVSISAEVCILTADHDLQSPTFMGRTSRVTIGDFAFVGTRAMLLPGVNVGKGAAIAAGAIVTKDVPERAIVAGCPAKQIGTRTSAFEYTAIYYRPFSWTASELCSFFNNPFFDRMALLLAYHVTTAAETSFIVPLRAPAAHFERH